VAFQARHLSFEVFEYHVIAVPYDSLFFDDEYEERNTHLS
jgi:hypothetical protein